MDDARLAEGVIYADALYTLDALHRRLRLGKAAMRTARRKGLVVKRIGRQTYVRGADILDYYDRQGRQV